MFSVVWVIVITDLLMYKSCKSLRLISGFEQKFSLWESLLNLWQSTFYMKMERKIQNLEDHVRFLYDELESKEKEIDDLKKSFDYSNDMCKKKSAHNRRDQDDIQERKNIV